MGSRVSSEGKTSSESSLQECQTLLQSPSRLNCRQNKSSSKSIVSSKRLKTEHEVAKPSKNRKISVDNPFEEKENTLRRSKRRKTCDSNVQLEEIAPTDLKHHFKNDVKEIEDENLQQNLCFNLLPANVKKNLDKELFSEESDEEQNLNIKCPEAMSKEKQLVVSLKDINEAVKVDNTVQQAGNLDDGKTATRKADCDTRRVPNSSQLFGEIIAYNENNENEIDTEKEEIKENSTRDMTNDVFFNIDDNGKYERSNNTKFGTNDKMISDPSLDLLHVDIKKADNIINSLKLMDSETNCSVRKQTRHASSSKPRLSVDGSMVGSFYTKEDKNVSDDNARQNFGALSENSSESEPSTSSKNCEILIDDQQENSLENINYMENKLNEIIDDTPSCNGHLTAKEKCNEVKYNLLKNKDSNHFDASSTISENLNKITNPWHEYDSSAKFNNQTLSERELNKFQMENGNSRENNDFDNSQSSKKVIQKFHIEINDRKNITDDLQISVEHLEMKRKKLTLHYMSALDYEKENKENGLAMKQTGNETENGNFDIDGEDETVDNDIFIAQKGMEMSKQDLDNLPKEIDDKDVKNNIIKEIIFKEIHQNINSNGILDEKEQVKEDNTHQNPAEMKKGVHDSQVTCNTTASQVTNDTASNEQHSSKDQSPIKCGLTCYEETNKMHDSQEHFTTMQDQGNNISLSQTSSNTSVCNNEPNVVEVVDTKNEETEKWCKTKCISEAEATFVTATASEQNKNSTEMVKDENTENLKEDLPSHEGKVLFKYKI